MTTNNCELCPRRCGVERSSRNGNGFCGMGSDPVIARAALHFGEEPCISGTRGSGTIFFSGCPLRCRFCQNDKISHHRYGRYVTVERLADIFRELEQSGAHNINLVNPTHFAASICKAIELYNPSVPVVYNSSGYERVEALRMLDGMIDVYLPDCKYVHNDIADEFSGASDYFAYASQAIPEMARQTGIVTLDAEGIITKGTIVRHLVLPGHTRESMAVLDWLAQHKERLWVSLMFQYTPMGDIAAHKELQRTLTRRECDKVWSYMQSLGIQNGYVQSRQSAGEDAIPTFDLTGV